MVLGYDFTTQKWIWHYSPIPNLEVIKKYWITCTVVHGKSYNLVNVLAIEELLVTGTVFENHTKSRILQYCEQSEQHLFS